jgi:hypothetical protein
MTVQELIGALLYKFEVIKQNDEFLKQLWYELTGMLDRYNNLKSLRDTGKDLSGYEWTMSKDVVIERILVLDEMMKDQRTFIQTYMEKSKFWRDEIKKEIADFVTQYTNALQRGKSYHKTPFERIPIREEPTTPLPPHK